MTSGSITRRGVLTGAAAMASVTALPRLLMPRSAIGHVVLDERLPQSALFASGFNGPHVHGVNALDDLCNRWYTQLRAAVLADSGHIAGLTTWMDYVVMRSCAAEIGYRRAFHAEHLPLGATGVTHSVTGQPALLSMVAAPAQPQTWARILGQALASGAHLRSRFMPGEVFSATTPAAAGSVRMITWVFSPRS